ncbi:hypothetical protein DV515_00011079 [Chloebia gouldiae]|uniref:Immunoglobulin-like beta-sandwich domain-containing protein n=1 Tax=Chloebia gouldiae TaxID=44316 RepID=A0A3L8S7W8_CHLGU|nr:hypothetical protein DV515_00011079 [Chloebia gouldiae]
MRGKPGSSVGLAEGQKGLKVENKAFFSRLTFFNVSEQDYGNYTCVASNQLGNTNASMILYDKREVDAVAALPVHKKRLFCDILGDNFVSGPFSLKLSVLEVFPHKWRFNLCRYRDMSLFGIVREANVAFIF